LIYHKNTDQNTAKTPIEILNSRFDAGLRKCGEKTKLFEKVLKCFAFWTEGMGKFAQL
jgi:hypothetical protein